MSTIRWLGTKPQSKVRWLGDLWCGSTDIDQFKANYRVPMYPEQWNVWLVRRTLRDGASLAEITGTVQQVMDQWFKFMRFNGHASDLTISVSPVASALKNFTPVASITTNKVPVTVVGPDVLILCKFVYRGSKPTIPWPVWKYSLGQFFNNWCPEDADWAVDTVYAPLGDAVPKESMIPDWVKALVPDIKIPDFSGIFVGAIILAGLYVASQVLSKVPSAAPRQLPAPAKKEST